VDSYKGGKINWTLWEKKHIFQYFCIIEMVDSRRRKGLSNTKTQAVITKENVQY